MLRHRRHSAAFSLGRGPNGECALTLARLRRLVDVPSLLVMRPLGCREALAGLTEGEFVEDLSLIESYLVRRAICGKQTKGQ